MDSKTTIQCNKLMQSENSMFMYGIYNAEMLEKLINTVHHIHNMTSSHERLFESLAACQDTNSNLTMYFTVNTTFVNYFG